MFILIPYFLNMLFEVGVDIFCDKNHQPTLQIQPPSSVTPFYYAKNIYYVKLYVGQPRTFIGLFVHI